MDKFLKNNIVLRILAVVIACILWFTINVPANGSTPRQSVNAKDFPYAVQVNLPSNMMVTDLTDPTAVVEVTGSILSDNSLPAEMMGVEVIADGRGLAPGKHVIPLKAQGMPPVQYTIVPSSITVTVATKSTVQKPVKVNVTGTPASGYEAGTATTTVPTVEVSGVSSAVNRVVAVTADISVAGAKTSVSHTLTLQPVDKYGKSVPGVQVDPVSVTVTVPVSPPQVSLQVVPEVVGQPAAGFAVAGVSVAPGSVSISGTPDSTANVSNLPLPVDVQNMRTTQSVQVSIPSRSDWTVVSPSQVQVTIKIEQSASVMESNIPLQVENVPSGMTVQLGNKKSVSVRVTGPKSIISKLKPSDIVAYVDASSLSSNSTSGPVGVALPQWVHVSQISDNEVPVVASPSPAGSGSANNNSAQDASNVAG